MRIRIVASLIAILLALPVILTAGHMWSIAEGPTSYMGFEYAIGDFLYWLGAPLTALRVVYTSFCGPIQRQDIPQAILIMDALFLVQWLIWSQMIVGLYRVVTARLHGIGGE